METKKINVGSENVFKDLGYANPEERLAKSELARSINAILKKKKWTQTKAAEVLGIPQPKVSLLSKGIVSGFSLGKLMTLLGKLNQDIDIIVHEKVNAKRTRRPIAGRIRVIFSLKPSYAANATR